MFKLLLISLPFFLLGCAGAVGEPEGVNLVKLQPEIESDKQSKIGVGSIKDLDGEYTLEVQCREHRGITRSLKVSSGKMSGRISVGPDVLNFSGNIKKDGTISGYASGGYVSGPLQGKIAHWENGIAEGKAYFRGAYTCVAFWKATSNKPK